MNQEQDQDLKTKVAILEKDISQIVTLCTKLENTIDSMKELSYGVSSIIKLHEAKLEQQEKEVVVLHSRVDDHVEFHNLMKNNLSNEFTDEMEDLESCIKDIKKRVRTIEKWQQYFIGGAIVLGAVFGGGQKLLSFFN